MATKTKSNKSLLVFTIAALGVVFGDIGTSPLYAINQIFFGRGQVPLTQDAILGSISLVFWALTIVIAFKYVVLILRADNQGSGGVFALLSILSEHKAKATFAVSSILILSAGLLFGDGMITPAISVLSAVEGLKIAAPSLTPLVIPLTLIILTALFTLQRKGPTKLGIFFGPIIAIWFGALAVLGLAHILQTPQIISALNPAHGLQFIAAIGVFKTLLALGAIVLVITGGEALFLDLGHFGKRPIRFSWFALVYPALVFNYLGQGAYLLSGREVLGQNVFYSMVPAVALIPMIILATAASIIASQALIAGAFSLAAQGIALGLSPRLQIVHTHKRQYGQIYLPFVNWSLYLGCILLVLFFKSSGHLAGAYGLAVSADMAVTSLAMILISRYRWQWSLLKAVVVWLPLIAIDLIFLLANSFKLFHGGLIPLAIGLNLFIIMTTWRWGRKKINQAYERYSTMTIAELLSIKRKSSKFFPRSMVILTAKHVDKPEHGAPAQVQLFLEKYGLLPKHLILLTIETARVPYVHQRYKITPFQNEAGGGSLAAVEARFGFMEHPDVGRVLEDISNNKELVVSEDLKSWIVFVGKERLIPSDRIKRTNSFRYKLFKLLSHNAEPAYMYFGLGDDTRLSTEIVPVHID